MANVVPFKRPTNWDRLRADDAEKLVQERASKTDNVIFTNHATVRIDQRNISAIEVFRILRTGTIHNPPVRNEKGDWEVLVTKRITGNHREAGVATIILTADDKLVVKTVRWEDI